MRFSETAKEKLIALAAWISERETWFVLLAVPPLLLPEYLRSLLPSAVALLLVLLLCRLATRRPWRLGGWLDLALLILLIMLPVSLSISSDPQRSFPKFTTTIIGMFLFWSLTLGVRRQTWRAASILLALSGLGLVGLALLGTNWPSSKVLYLSGLYDRFPRLITGLPRSTRGGFDANEVAGALLMLLPVVLSALLAAWQGRKSAAPPSLRDLLLWRRLPGIMSSPSLLLALLALAFSAMAALFILTQSRGALVGLLIGLAVMLVLRWRRLLLVFLGLAAIAIMVDLTAGEGWLRTVFAPPQVQALPGGQTGAMLDALNTLARVGSGSSATATGRVEMWGNALRAITDYPLTGIGFHTFPAVSWANYVYITVSPTFNMTHAHNAYLQAGVDFGVAGLVGFIILASVLLYRGWRVLGRLPGWERWLACGLMGGVTGHLVHSLVDVAGRPLGDKPGIIFWAIAGLLVALDRLYRQPTAIVDAAPRGRQSADDVHSGSGHAGPHLQSIRRARSWLVLAAGALLLLVIATGALGPIVRLNLGAVALDQARLKSELSGSERQALLHRAASMLSAALPWRADTVYLRLGLVEQERGQIDAARAYWARTSLALPYLLAQGDARQVMGQTRVAKDYYAHAVALAPASSSARYRMGTVELARGDYVAALSSLQDALALDTYNDPSEKGKTYSALGSVMAAQGRWGDAVAFYEQAEAASPHFEDQGALAQALYRRDGNAQAAESYLRQSIAGKPGLVGPYVALMDILHSQGRDSEALDLGRQAMRRFPENTEPLLAAGRIYMAQDAYTEAENMFQRATVLRPRQAEARYWLGRAALAQQNLALAVQAFTEAVALAPGDSGYQTLLGNALHLTGDKAGAAAAYRRALEIDPNNATARRGLEGLTR